MSKRKDNRGTLGEYYGQAVEIEGCYVAEKDTVSFKYNEEICKMQPRTLYNHDPRNEKISPAVLVDNEKAPFQIPAYLADKASVITNVHGIGAFSTINEGHIIIQSNIHRSYNIPYNSHVKIYGIVGAYKGKNKKDGHDFCIQSILRCDVVK